MTLFLPLFPFSSVFSPDMNSSYIKSLTQELGFDEVGVTRPASLKEGEQAIHDWVREGRHGSMKYLEDFQRRRERLYREFPDAKSVIVLGVNYYSHNSPHTTHNGLLGRIARYAWGLDYHKVIRKRHEEFIEQLSQGVGSGFRAQSCIDTQPIPERFAAVKAGLGFIGKHTNLLSRRFGPWLFLSEIVTNLELEEDLPAEGDCGTCSHCQAVCPTGALDQDYRIDARKCIAYLTIEHKGVIPCELRPKIKDWIFGCDECLAVCPFTSKQKETTWKEFTPPVSFPHDFRRESSDTGSPTKPFGDDIGHGVGEFVSLDDLFNLPSQGAYEKRFKNTALLRASRKQMLRNACIVLGNSGRAEAIPYLEKALNDPSPPVREHAAWGLEQLQTTSRQTKMTIV